MQHSRAEAGRAIATRCSALASIVHGLSPLDAMGGESGSPTVKLCDIRVALRGSLKASMYNCSAKFGIYATAFIGERHGY